MTAFDWTVTRPASTLTGRQTPASTCSPPPRCRHANECSANSAALKRRRKRMRKKRRSSRVMRRKNPARKAKRRPRKQRTSPPGWVGEHSAESISYCTHEILILMWTLAGRLLPRLHFRCCHWGNIKHFVTHILKWVYMYSLNVLHFNAPVSVQRPDHRSTEKSPMSSDPHHGSLTSFPESLLLFPKWVMRCVHKTIEEELYRTMRRHFFSTSWMIFVFIFLAGNYDL